MLCVAGDPLFIACYCVVQMVIEVCMLGGQAGTGTLLTGGSRYSLLRRLFVPMEAIKVYFSFHRWLLHISFTLEK